MNSENLEDLKPNFLRNLAEHKVGDFVKLYEIDVREVSIEEPARMLVIDGEHTADAVLSNFEQFRDLLMPGSLVIFDDFNRASFPGVVEAVMAIYEPEQGADLVN